MTLTIAVGYGGREEIADADVLWPAFRKVDLLRAIRAYRARSRRCGR